MNAVVEATPSSGALMSFIERAARDETFDVSKFEALLRMQRELAESQAKQAFNAAMARVQTEIGAVVRDRVNTGVSRKYATLEGMDAAARPIYSQHGFSVRFGCAPSPKQGELRITCTVSHEAGYSEQLYLDAPADQGRNRSPVQAVGSTITYMRRYLLQMAFNLVMADDDTDDDGETTRRDRQAADAYPPDRRSQINAETPMNNQQQMTPAKFMDALEIALRDCGTIEAVHKMTGSARVQSAVKAFKGVDQARLQGIIAAAIQAHTPVTHKQEEDDGWPGPRPEGPDDLEIKGEEKLLAG